MLKEIPVLKVMMEHREMMVLPDHKEPQDHKALRDQQEIKALKE